MFEEEFKKIPVGDQREFAHVINNLLLKGYVVRDVFDSKEKMMRTNSDYRFVERYFPLVESYLKFSGWTINKDVLLGVVSLSNDYEDNRIRLDRETSLILFTLRLIFETEKNESSQTGEAIYMTTPGLIKFMLDHGISMPGKKLSGRQIARSIRYLVNHNILNKVSGSYDEGSVSFYILPSIVYALDNEKIVAMSNAIDKLNNDSTDEEKSGNSLEDIEDENDTKEVTTDEDLN